MNKDAASRAAPRLLLLTALFPGLGHLVAGKRRWAMALAVPVLVPVLVVVGLALVGRATLAVRLVDPTVLGVVLVAQLLLLAWRLVALAAVHPVAPLTRRPTTIAAALLAVALVVGPQAYAAALTALARDAATEIFSPEDTGAWTPPDDATPVPVASDDVDFATAPPTPTPEPTPSVTPAGERVTILLIGMDSGIGRNTALTDTMIVASLDPIGRTVSMVSVPRDLVDAPLPDGRVFRPKINGLVSYVRWNPSKFPGAANGQSVLAAALGELLGVRIDYWAQVDLGSFIRVVDSVGGVDINVTDGFCDPSYDEYGINGFGVRPGRYHMTGSQALAYARVRKAAGENDFTRAARQQDVVVALRDRVVAGGFLNDPAGFITSLGKTVKTSVPPSLVAEHVDVAMGLKRTDVFRIVIQHPLVRSGYDARGSIQLPDLAGIRALGAQLFTPVGVRPEGLEPLADDPGGKARPASSSTTCGITPTPRPTPTPTASPSESPSPDASTEPTPTGSPDASAWPSPSSSPPQPPSPSPSPSPTASGGATPSPGPSPSPSPSPSGGPVSSPSGASSPPAGPSGGSGAGG